MLNDIENGIKLLHQLHGYIHIILGNHDSINRVIRYFESGVIEIQSGKHFNYSGYRFYLSHYPTLCSNQDEDKDLKYRTINLCGHSHTTDPFLHWNIGLIYHVELDAHNMMPISIDTIISEIEKKFNS